MKGKLGLLAATATVIISLAGCGKADITDKAQEDTKKTVPSNAQQEKFNEHSFKIKELKYELKTDKVQYKIGEKIKVKASVENTSDSTYKFGGDPCVGKLGINITDYHTMMHLKGEGDIIAEICTQEYVEHSLKPHEKLTAEATFDTNKIVRINEGTEEPLKPGKFVVVTHYNLDSSATVGIEIK